MSKVVFALGILLDVLPLEIGATATETGLAMVLEITIGTHRLPSLRTVCMRSMLAT